MFSVGRTASHSGHASKLTAVYTGAAVSAMVKLPWKTPAQTFVLEPEKYTKYQVHHFVVAVCNINQKEPYCRRFVSVFATPYRIPTQANGRVSSHETEAIGSKDARKNCGGQ